MTDKQPAARPSEAAMAIVREIRKREGQAREATELSQEVSFAARYNKLVAASDTAAALVIDRAMVAGEPVAAPDTAALVERLKATADGDHKRGCEGRNYSCECGYDEDVALALDAAIPTLRTITAERDALQKRVGELEVSVELAAVWFDGYANAHYAKAINAPDGKEQHSREVKGKTNADRAKELRATLKGTDHG